MNTRKLTRTALFAALTAAGAFIRIPLGYSSITLQFLCTAMAGCLLGPAYGAASQAVYVALGLIGLPIFTQGGGLSYLMQPTCGFLIGLIPTAWLIGLLTAKRELRPLRTAAACLAGLAMLYAVGLPYMAVILNGYMGKGMDVSAILWAGMLPFLPGDMLKIAVTALLAPLLGLSDAIVDIVETGNTLVANGLKVYEDICRISARMIVNKASLKNNKEVLPFICKIESLVGNEEVPFE